MKLIIKFIRHHAPETYNQFTLIDISFINTSQILSINIVIFNLFFQLGHEKHRTLYSEN